MFKVHTHVDANMAFSLQLIELSGIAANYRL